MQRVSRRLILAAPALLLGGRAWAAMLCPGREAAVSLTAEGNQSVFHCDGVDGAISVPDAGARVAALLPIAGRQVAGIAFAADGAATLMALAGWDGARLRVLGLELLRWSGADGRAISSRFSGVGDRTRLRMRRDAEIPGKGLTPHWESWTDLLAWRDGAPLADAPVRAPLAGTMQARLGAVRQRSIALLEPPVQVLTAEMVASLNLAAALG